MEKLRTFFDESKAFTVAILLQMSKLNKCQRKFILDCALCFLGIQGRITFMSLSRFGSYSETTYRHGFQKSFDFSAFNRLLISESTHGQGFISFDPTYLPKSGSSTYGAGKFWSGVAGKAQWGLEFSGLAYVDTQQETAYSIQAEQTPCVSTLRAEDKTLIDHYVAVIQKHHLDLESLSRYLVVDSYFAKQKFLDGIENNTNLFVISKLRKDANACYLYEGLQKKGRGRPKKYDGKVCWDDLNEKYACLVDETQEYQLYELTVWMVKFQRKLKVAIERKKDKKGAWKTTKILFSTDLMLSAQQIYDWYKLRFQIEFTFRDAKQETGLTHCQARNQKAIHFHVNMALMSLNIAKAVARKSNAQKKQTFSIKDCKQLFFNQFALDRKSVV